jgi:flavodoxin
VKTVILYASKSGNTKKISDAIASELNCQAIEISDHCKVSADFLNGFELVFVGTGIYAGNPNPQMERFLKNADLGAAKLFAVFVTWGGAGNTCQLVAEKICKLLELKRQKVVGKTFCCYGGWKYALLRRGHPDLKDMVDARKWARNLVSDTQK